MVSFEIKIGRKKKLYLGHWGTVWDSFGILFSILLDHSDSWVRYLFLKSFWGLVVFFSVDCLKENSDEVIVYHLFLVIWIDWTVWTVEIILRFLQLSVWPSKRVKTWVKGKWKWEAGKRRSGNASFRSFLSNDRQESSFLLLPPVIRCLWRLTTHLVLSFFRFTRSRRRAEEQQNLVYLFLFSRPGYDYLSI